jgi:hypothetical protein
MGTIYFISTNDNLQARIQFDFEHPYIFHDIVHYFTLEVK